MNLLEGRNSYLKSLYSFCHKICLLDISSVVIALLCEKHNCKQSYGYAHKNKMAIIVRNDSPTSAVVFIAPESWFRNSVLL